MGIFDYFKKSVPMRGNVSHVERDKAGNIWYLSDLFGTRHKWRVNFNMTNAADKREALQACTPLQTVLDKMGSMMQRGELYVTDADGNEEKFQAFKDALLNPNPLQTFSAFIRDVEICLRLFGFCPVSVMRGMKTMPVSAMWIIKPELFHLEGTGKMYKQFELQEIVDKAYFMWGGRKVYLEPDEYFVIHNGSIDYEPTMKELRFSSLADSLSIPVSNWMSAMSANHVLITNGGPKGVLYNDYQDSMGNNPMTGEEKAEIHRQFNERYGIVGDKSPIFISTNKLGWLPMDYNADQLKIGDTDDRCTAKICAALGLNQNLFTDAKYDNQESAKKAAYQDVIQPDAKVICEALTKNIMPEGATVSLDFSDVECLQKSKKDEAGTLQTAANAIKVLLDGGLISFEEARQELSNYIDIDPDEVKGKEGNDE